jgi:hypothetical protein
MKKVTQSKENLNGFKLEQNLDFSRKKLQSKLIQQQIAIYSRHKNIKTEFSHLLSSNFSIPPHLI